MRQALTLVMRIHRVIAFVIAALALALAMTTAHVLEMPPPTRIVGLKWQPSTPSHSITPSLDLEQVARSRPSSAGLRRLQPEDARRELRARRTIDAPLELRLNVFAIRIR